MRRSLLLSSWVWLLAIPLLHAQTVSTYAPIPPNPDTKANTETQPGDPVPPGDYPGCEGEMVDPFVPTTGPRFWASGEWLYWKPQGSNLPPLVTTSPAGTPRTSAGVLGAPGTQVLFGNVKQNNDWQSGFRVSGGVWLGECARWGVGASFFRLGDQQDNFRASSTGQPILARPFFNVASGAQDSELLAFPGVLAGTGAVSSSSGLWGGGVNVRKHLCCGCTWWIDGLVGYRYLRLRDDVTISENLLVTGPSSLAPVGTQLDVVDRFQASNNFHGGQVGVVGRLIGETFWLGLGASVALGVNDREVDIAGTTTVRAPGAAPVTRSGGLLALGTNSGHFEDTAFTVVPEVTLKAGVFLTESLSLFVGYNFLYWSSVYRAGEQIDPVVNPSQIPPGTLVGPARPAFPGRESGFWVHGVSAGAALRW
jgi:hypothetical protein